MIEPPKLIYCAGGNKRFAEIAVSCGFLYGARLPRDKPHFPIYFADQDWHKPNRIRYMTELELYRPKMATVLDLEPRRPLNEVLSWAEEATQFCHQIVIIPKVESIIAKIPKKINQKDIILGYSIPTAYGSTPVEPEEFKNRIVHLLGGSPHRQIELWRKMRKICHVFSVDGNYIQKVALRFNKFWTFGTAYYAENRWLPRLDEADGVRWVVDAPYEAFKRSCHNVFKAWRLVI